ncbi:MAG: prepilin-type N-terminal cleavage/methylation domain-containing protein, partial [Cyanobacteria bacterium J06626_18]
MTPSKHIKRWLLSRSQRKENSTSGFTLLELLIALFVGSLIISGLLYLVVEMLKIERRETAVDDTQRDMKRALEYIASDVSEAVYVYAPFSRDPGSGAINVETWADSDQGRVIEELDAQGEIDSDRVVLAFWRPDFVEDNDLIPLGDCSGFSDEIEEECQNLIERRAYYTLVVYEILPRDIDNPDGVWRGEARLTRYELPKFDDPSTMAINTAYDLNDVVDDDPTDNTFFTTWEPQNPVGNRVVLVDFVANPTVDNQAECRSENELFVRIPEKAVSSSFFTCVRIPEGEVGQTDNQNLEIFLQGDPALSDGQEDALGVGVLNERSLLPILHTG